MTLKTPWYVDDIGCLCDVLGVEPQDLLSDDHDD
jgi:hypothetical protein